MYIPLNIKSDRRILITYDIHRQPLLEKLKLHILFKSYFKDYQFFAEYIGYKNSTIHVFEWLKSNYPETDFDPVLKKYFLQHDGVIGYELPKNMIHFLKKNKIPYINYHNSIYRCTDIEHVAIETNMNLSNFFIPNKAKFQNANLNIGTLLIGQTPFDRTLINNNKFISLIDYEKLIKKLPEPIYFSSHPEGNDRLLAWAEEQNFKIALEPTYNLLESNPKIVCGVSSSVLYEARDIWKLPVLFLEENKDINSFLQLPFEIAFDHEIINSILDEKELETKFLIFEKYQKLLNSQKGLTSEE